MTPFDTGKRAMKVTGAVEKEETEREKLYYILGVQIKLLEENVAENLNFHENVKKMCTSSSIFLFSNTNQR